MIIDPHLADLIVDLQRVTTQLAEFVRRGDVPTVTDKLLAALRLAANDKRRDCVTAPKRMVAISALYQSTWGYAECADLFGLTRDAARHAHATVKEHLSLPDQYPRTVAFAKIAKKIMAAEGYDVFPDLRDDESN